MNALLRGEGEVSQPTAGRTARGVWLIVRRSGVGRGGGVDPGDKNLQTPLEISNICVNT